jgi:hypothetical protein
VNIARSLAQGHPERFPAHSLYLVKTLIDPLMLPETELRMRFAVLEGKAPSSEYSHRDDFDLDSREGNSSPSAGCVQSSGVFLLVKLREMAHV